MWLLMVLNKLAEFHRNNNQLVLWFLDPVYMLGEPHQSTHLVHSQCLVVEAVSSRPARDQSHIHSRNHHYPRSSQHSGYSDYSGLSD